MREQIRDFDLIVLTDIPCSIFDTSCSIGIYPGPKIGL